MGLFVGFVWDKPSSTLSYCVLSGNSKERATLCNNTIGLQA